MYLVLDIFQPADQHSPTAQSPGHPEWSGFPLACLWQGCAPIVPGPKVICRVPGISSRCASPEASVLSGFR